MSVQIFFAPPWFVDVLPMNKKEETGYALSDLINEWSIYRFFRTYQAK